jgi:hypothetical protein
MPWSGVQAFRSKTGVKAMPVPFSHTTVKPQRWQHLTVLGYLKRTKSKNDTHQKSSKMKPLFVTGALNMSN